MDTTAKTQASASANCGAGVVLPQQWLCVMALAVVACGGDRQPWVHALALLVIGLTLLGFARQRLGPPAVVTTCLWVMTLVPLWHLLPELMGGLGEPWRHELQQEWGLSFSATVSPQWRVTLEGWLGLLAALAWSQICLMATWNERQSRRALWTLAMGVAALALLSLLEQRGFLRIPLWPRGLPGSNLEPSAGFGPFANPNHSSSLFAMGVVLCAAAAFDGFQRRRLRGWIALLGLGACLAAIMANSSRAGLLLALLGLVLWLGTSAMSGGRRLRLAVLFVVMAAGLSVAFLSGSRSVRRLVESSDSAVWPQDLRLLVMRECATWSLQAPWIGRGLGQFAYTFPLLTEGGMSETRVIHPESDLLWGFFEGGLWLALPALFLVGWCLRRGDPWWESQRRRQRQHSRSAKRIRRAMGLAALMGLLHGLVDVPLHNFGYFLFLALLLCISVRGELVQGVSSVSARLWALTVSLGLLCWGAAWLCSVALPDHAPPLASGALWHHQRALEAAKLGRPRQAMTEINQAIAMTPMEYRWYFLRAQLHLVMGGEPAVAMEDFGRARALEPHLALIGIEEGAYWLRFEPSLALVAWAEALRRYPENSRWSSLRFRQMMEKSMDQPELHDQLWTLANTVPRQLIYLQLQPAGEHWSRCLEQFLLRHPQLEDLALWQSRLLFQLWERKGDVQAAVAWLGQRPQLESQGWPLLARVQARNGNFTAACELVMRHFEGLLKWTGESNERSGLSLEALQRAVVLSPQDARRGVELLRAQWAAGEWDAALRNAERMKALSDAPQFLGLARAAILFRMGRSREAWQSFEPMIEPSLVVGEHSPNDDEGTPMTWSSRILPPEALARPRPQPVKALLRF